MFACRFELMEHASTQAALDYMKKLAGVSYDFELAQKLGYSKQALSSVKKRQKIPMKWLAKASILFKVPVEELQAAGQKDWYAKKDQEPHSESAYSVAEKDSDALTLERRIFEEEKRLFWEEKKEIIEENRRLHQEKDALYREKECLLREIGELREKVARLEERKNRLAIASDQPAQNSGVA